MTYGRHYRRNLVLHYYQSGLGCKKLAQLTVPRVSLSTVRRIITRFRRYGDYETPASGRRRRAGLIPSDRVDWLVAFLKERDCTLYLDEMVEQLRDQFGTTYSIWSVCRALLRRRITRKKISVIAARRNVLERAVFKADMAKYNPHQLVFLDETRKEPRTLNRRYGRARARALHSLPFTRHASGFSALGVFTVRGMIDCAVTDERGVDADTFIRHLAEHVVPRVARRPRSRLAVSRCASRAGT